MRYSRATAPDQRVRSQYAERAGSANIGSLIVGRSWSARGWRVAAVCTVLLMVSVGVYRMQTNPAVEGSSPSPMVETSSKPSAVVDVPAQPQSTLTPSQPCAPRSVTGEAIKAQNFAPADTPTPAISTAPPDCAPTPGRTFAEIRPKRSRQPPRAIGQRRHGRPPARAMRQSRRRERRPLAQWRPDQGRSLAACIRHEGSYYPDTSSRRASRCARHTSGKFRRTTVDRLSMANS